ncbi:hypothetical protein GOODEAATRI_017275 [Goodea atripinnis]|uniref:Uncharacterized protein n=1 Tax=Goodea atripinnis TaxID=208336 RepID=A0ABV0NBD3_9TELE
MEPSVLQLNFNIQPRHVRLQSDDLAGPRIVCDGPSPSFLLTYSQNHSPGLPLWRPFSVIPSPDRAAFLPTPIWIYPTSLSSPRSCRSMILSFHLLPPPEVPYNSPAKRRRG